MFTSLFKCRSQREEIGSEETKMSVLHMISYDWDQPAAWELQVIAEERKKKFVNLLSNKNIKNTTMFVSLLIASDVERHGT